MTYPLVRGKDTGKIRSCHRRIRRKGIQKEEKDRTFKNRNKKGSEGMSSNKRWMRQQIAKNGRNSVEKLSGCQLPAGDEAGCYGILEQRTQVCYVWWVPSNNRWRHNPQQDNTEMENNSLQTFTAIWQSDFLSTNSNNKNCSLIFCTSFIYFSISFFSFCVLKRIGP